MEPSAFLGGFRGKLKQVGTPQDSRRAGGGQNGEGIFLDREEDRSGPERRTGMVEEASAISYPPLLNLKVQQIQRPEFVPAMKLAQI